MRAERREESTEREREKEEREREKEERELKKAEVGPSSLLHFFFFGGAFGGCV